MTLASRPEHRALTANQPATPHTERVHPTLLALKEPWSDWARHSQPAGTEIRGAGRFGGNTEVVRILEVALLVVIDVLRAIQHA